MLEEKEIMDVIKGYVEVNNDVENDTLKYHPRTKMEISIP